MKWFKLLLGKPEVPGERGWGCKECNIYSYDPEEMQKHIDWHLTLKYGDDYKRLKTVT